jgi:primosomal protein N' (replication factor Y)
VERCVSVAVPVPALDLLTYRLPESLPWPVPGARVDVPLGARRVTGIVVEAPAAPPSGDRVRLRDVIAIRDASAFVPPSLLHLTQWVADYYLAGPGDVLATALPPRVLTGDERTFRRRRVAALTAAGVHAADQARLGPRCAPPGDDGPDALRLGRRQREALILLAGTPAGLATAALADRGITAATLARLSQSGLVVVRHEAVDRDPFAGHATLAAPPPPAELTGEQQAALARLRPLADDGEFRTALVRGVTGSGKTEIYLQLADHVRRGGRQVLMLVPEIALTPALAGRVRDRFGERVAIQHSGLSDGERHDQWHRVRGGEVDVVVGTRSAVFAPLDRLGLVVVDEEHDTSYKQDESPRYHGRDVAVVRAQQSGALAVLGSATPSLETFHNAQRGRYAAITLSRRVADRAMATVHVVNMRDEWAEAGEEVVISRPLAAALSARLAQGEQSLVLLNRRGIATAVLCRQCGSSVECPHCAVSMTVHGSGRRAEVRCHYCDHATIRPTTCPNCAAPYLEHVGFGTERVEEELRRVLPEARIARVDRDTVRRKGALTELLARFARRELDVLVGTQMIAKGHDFPMVTLVGVISADVGLAIADFRAAERTFQLITQVVGRAGRGERPGEAVVQTLVPEHYAVKCGSAQDYDTFVAKELYYRDAMRYPPITGMVNVVVRGATADEAMRAAGVLAGEVRQRGGDGLQLLGPAPAPLARLRGEYRAQFFLKGGHRGRMRDAIRAALAAHPALSRRTIVDVDPVSML